MFTRPIPRFTQFYWYPLYFAAGLRDRIQEYFDKDIVRRSFS
jgi:hypothetical protein